MQLTQRGGLRLTIPVSLAILIALPSISLANRPSTANQKTLAPFFVVKGDSKTVDGLPLKGTHAEVDISGVIARVKITQTYKNTGKTPLEATYVFPASTRAAVFGMTMHIGKRKLTAKIKAREEARKLYEQAKRQGRSASLLEQQRPNVFQMNVANIMPGDEIRVELLYSELLVPEDGVYKFVYPAVVGPRYTEKTATTAGTRSKWSKQPYFRQGKKTPYQWGFKANLTAGLPIQKLSSPTHKIDVGGTGTPSATVHLGDGATGGNRDLVLEYELRGKKTQTGLMLFEGKSEKFFLMMAQPPKQVTKREMPRREYVFIIDVSGSMFGFPLKVAREMAGELLDGLQSGDSFNILTFSGGNRVMSPKSLPANTANIARAKQELATLRGGGGTRLLPALKKALSMPSTRDTARTFVVITDGYVMVEDKVFRLIRKSLTHANLFAFGIGSSVNRHLIEGMARAGMGEPFVVLRNQDAAKHARKFRKYISAPVLTDISVKFNGFTAYDVEPAAVPDLFAQRPVLIFGKYKGSARGTVTLSGKTGNGAYTKTIDISKVKPDAKREALRYLWARHRIATLSDMQTRWLRGNDNYKADITKLGLKYGLMTKYTSFIAIDDRVRNKDGKFTKVSQPLPLPGGVSNRAVGRASGFKFSSRRASSNTVSGSLHMPRRSPRYVKMKRMIKLGGLGNRGGGLAPTKPSPEPAETEKSERTTRQRAATLLDRFTVAGPANANVFRRTLQRHQHRLRAIYQRLLKRRPGLRGRITVSLTIDSTGRVSSVTLPTNTLGLSRAEKAAFKATLQRLRFAAASTAVTVTFRLSFAP
jgi:Ca-activated chloride channel family protein